MSNHATRSGHGTGPSSRRRIRVEKSPPAKSPVVNRVDVSALAIDESFDANCDPYNSTGQFLAAELRRRARDR